ncbi:MAG: ribonuclease E inhibitor RraB [Propionibacteriaceae bacterium]|nr:ribonuclease E inhibitor RraB [Propionibacteriaceae bacterium]
MGFFRRAKTVHFNTGHAGDDQLLTQLATMSDLTAPRHWVHYLYFPDEVVAHGAAEVVKAAGWELQEVAESAAGGPEWVVIAERHDAVTSPESVRDARVFFEAVAKQWPGGDYDGWEASA